VGAQELDLTIWSPRGTGHRGNRWLTAGGRRIAEQKGGEVWYEVSLRGAFKEGVFGVSKIGKNSGKTAQRALRLMIKSKEFWGGKENSENRKGAPVKKERGHYGRSHGGGKPKYSTSDDGSRRGRLKKILKSQGRMGTIQGRHR